MYVAGDQFCSAGTWCRISSRTRACRHERPILHSTQTTGFRLKFCVPRDFLIAAPDPEERNLRLSFHFQNSERRNGQSQGAPWTRFGWLNLFFADAHRNKLVLSGFARHKSGLGLSVFGCVSWSTWGEVAPHWYVLNPAKYRFRQINEVKHRRAGLVDYLDGWPPGNTPCNTWRIRHISKPRPQVGRVCLSHHQNTPKFTATKFDCSLDLSRKK